MVFVSNLIRALFLVMLLSSAAAWAERVSITKDTHLREVPQFDAKSVATVKQGAIGETTSKQGPWLRVTVAGKTGWVLTTDLRYVAAGNQQVVRQSLPAGTVVTIGTTNCFPDYEMTIRRGVEDKQLQFLDSFTVSKEDVARPDESLPAISIKR